MGAPYEIMIGTRYLRSTQRHGFLSFISLVSMLGLALGVAVLIVVLSVMNGFERELRTRILSVTAHATLMGIDGTLPDWRAAQRLAEAHPEVSAAVPYVEVQAMLVHGARSAPTQLRGVLPAQEQRAVSLAQHISGGSIDALAARELPDRARRCAGRVTRRRRGRRCGADCPARQCHAGRLCPDHAPLPGQRAVPLGDVRVRQRARTGPAPGHGAHLSVGR